MPKGIKSLDSYAFSRCKNTTIESWIEIFSDVNLATGYNGDYTQYNEIPKTAPGMFHMVVLKNTNLNFGGSQHGK